MPTVSFRFNLAQVEGQGEDADPILRFGSNLGLVGALDGMGGAGGTVYETPDGPRTGAYIASRVARDLVERRMIELFEPEWQLDGHATAAELHRALVEGLTTRLAELKAPPSALRSKLVRALPTTLALVALQRDEPAGSAWSAHVFWAGDSRVFVVEPDGGVRQLTTDDIRSGGDALHNLRDDSPVDNTVSADTEFRVNYRQVELSAPYLVVAATDGCFHYVRSPMHFEHLLLSTLQDAEDTESWRNAVQTKVCAVTGDDAAMALLGVGADFGGFQEMFAQRAHDLRHRFVAPLDEADAAVAHAEHQLEALRARRDALLHELWGTYKPEYEHYQAAKESRS
ncbi:MAG: protein phosphatase 2C domain-containing protein [Actinomycetota bacterium]|nr:protein phosphatase 2C domain-containing protein [Actinomycetota bacterium]